MDRFVVRKARVAVAQFPQARPARRRGRRARDLDSPSSSSAGSDEELSSSYTLSTAPNRGASPRSPGSDSSTALAQPAPSRGTLHAHLRPVQGSVLPQAQSSPRVPPTRRRRWPHGASVLEQLRLRRIGCDAHRDLKVARARQDAACHAAAAESCSLWQAPSPSVLAAPCAAHAAAGRFAVHVKSRCAVCTWVPGHRHTPPHVSVFWRLDNVAESVQALHLDDYACLVVTASGRNASLSLHLHLVTVVARRCGHALAASAQAARTVSWPDAGGGRPILAVQSALQAGQGPCLAVSWGSRLACFTLQPPVAGRPAWDLPPPTWHCSILDRRHTGSLHAWAGGQQAPRQAPEQGGGKPLPRRPRQAAFGLAARSGGAASVRGDRDSAHGTRGPTTSGSVPPASSLQGQQVTARPTLPGAAAGVRVPSALTRCQVAQKRLFDRVKSASGARPGLHAAPGSGRVVAVEWSGQFLLVGVGSTLQVWDTHRLSTPLFGSAAEPHLAQCVNVHSLFASPLAIVHPAGGGFTCPALAAPLRSTASGPGAGVETRFPGCAVLETCKNRIQGLVCIGQGSLALVVLVDGAAFTLDAQAGEVCSMGWGEGAPRASTPSLAPPAALRTAEATVSRAILRAGPVAAPRIGAASGQRIVPDPTDTRAVLIMHWHGETIRAIRLRHTGRASSCVGALRVLPSLHSTQLPWQGRGALEALEAAIPVPASGAWVAASASCSVGVQVVGEVCVSWSADVPSLLTLRRWLQLVKCPARP